MMLIKKDTFRCGLLITVPLGIAACAGAYADRTAYVDDPVAIGDTCLRSNQVANWQVVDSQTLVMEDTQGDDYRVELVGVCAGIEGVQPVLGFGTFSELSCLRSGDTIHYTDPTFGDETCTIASVEPIDEIAAARLLQ